MTSTQKFPLEKKIVTFFLTNFTEKYISWTSDGLSEPESEIARENMFVFLYTVKLHALKGQTYRWKNFKSLKKKKEGEKL